MSNLIKQIVAATFCMIAFNTVSGQKIMTLEDCRRQAVEYNKELKKADYQIQEAVSNQKTARTAYLPSVSAKSSIMYMPDMENISMPGSFLKTAVSAEAAQNGEFSGISDVWSPGINLPLENLSVFTGQVSVTQPIYVGGKINYSNKQADAGIDIFKYNYNIKYAEIIEQTDKSYWNLVSISSNTKLLEKYIEMLTELEDKMNDMYNIGITPLSEKLKVTVQKNEAELNLLKARNGLKVSKMYLNHILGQDLNLDIQVVNTLDENADILNNTDRDGSVLNRNELKILSKQLEISEYDKKIVQSEYLPQIGVSASYSTYYVKNILENVSFHPNIAGQISIPIIYWGQAKHKKDAARMKIKQAEIEFDNTSDLLNLEVQQVKVKIQETYEAIIIAKKNLTEATVSLDETKASFEAGLNTISELLNSQASWQSANAQLIGVLAQYQLLQTTWLRVSSNLNPTE